MTPEESDTMKETPALSFASDIRPMFTDVDVDHMKSFGLDLSSRDDVEKHANNILSVVSSGDMPPRTENRPWTKDMCAKFQQWMNSGYGP